MLTIIQNNFPIGDVSFSEICPFSELISYKVLFSHFKIGTDFRKRNDPNRQQKGESILKITCGIDIIEVARIKEAVENLDNQFLNKIYTPFEIEYCKSKKEMKYQHFAARFAAKEAIFKAISPMLKNKYEILWTDVEIFNSADGRPNVRFIKNKPSEVEQIDISLSHIKDYAIANCICQII